MQLQTTILRTVLLAVVALLLVAPTPARAGAPLPMLPTCSHGLHWIVNAGSLQHSVTIFPLALQRRYLNSPCTFLVIGRRVPVNYRNWNATFTLSSPNLKGVERLAKDPTVTVILYDPEAWHMTPPAEQRDPVSAICKAQSFAHAHGKLLIATPAINLIRFIAPGAERGGRRYSAFERAGLAERIARCTDIYEIQAQGSETETDKFRDFVQAEAQQARAANPQVIVLAGISTNPSGQHVSVARLYTAAQSVSSSVDGYWLNIPAGGKYCPRCGKPQPQVALQLLKMMHANDVP